MIDFISIWPKFIQLLFCLDKFLLICTCFWYSIFFEGESPCVFNMVVGSCKHHSKNMFYVARELLSTKSIDQHSYIRGIFIWSRVSFLNWKKILCYSTRLKIWSGFLKTLRKKPYHKKHPYGFLVNYSAMTYLDFELSAGFLKVEKCPKCCFEWYTIHCYNAIYLMQPCCVYCVFKSAYCDTIENRMVDILFSSKDSIIYFFTV